MFEKNIVKYGGFIMDWPVVIMMLVGVILLIKVISKIVRLLISIALISAIIYFVSSTINVATIMFARLG